MSLRSFLLTELREDAHHDTQIFFSMIRRVILRHAQQDRDAVNLQTASLHGWMMFISTSCSETHRLVSSVLALLFASARAVRTCTDQSISPLDVSAIDKCIVSLGYLMNFQIISAVDYFEAIPLEVPSSAPTIPTPLTRDSTHATRDASTALVRMLHTDDYSSLFDADELVARCNPSAMPASPASPLSQLAPQNSTPTTSTLPTPFPSLVSCSTLVPAVARPPLAPPHAVALALRLGAPALLSTLTSALSSLLLLVADALTLHEHVSAALPRALHTMTAPASVPAPVPLADALATAGDDEAKARVLLGATPPLVSALRLDGNGGDGNEGAAGNQVDAVERPPAETSARAEGPQHVPIGARSSGTVDVVGQAGLHTLDTCALSRAAALAHTLTAVHAHCPRAWVIHTLHASTAGSAADSLGSVSAAPSATVPVDAVSAPLRPHPLHIPHASQIERALPLVLPHLPHALAPPTPPLAALLDSLPHAPSSHAPALSLPHKLCELSVSLTVALDLLTRAPQPVPSAATALSTVSRASVLHALVAARFSCAADLCLLRASTPTAAVSAPLAALATPAALRALLLFALQEASSVALAALAPPASDGSAIAAGSAASPAQTTACGAPVGAALHSLAHALVARAVAPAPPRDHAGDTGTSTAPPTPSDALAATPLGTLRACGCSLCSTDSPVSVLAPMPSRVSVPALAGCTDRCTCGHALWDEHCATHHPSALSACVEWLPVRCCTRMAAPASPLCALLCRPLPILAHGVATVLNEAFSPAPLLAALACYSHVDAACALAAPYNAALSLPTPEAVSAGTPPALTRALGILALNWVPARTHYFRCARAHCDAPVFSHVQCRGAYFADVDTLRHCPLPVAAPAGTAFLASGVSHLCTTHLARALPLPTASLLRQHRFLVHHPAAPLTAALRTSIALVLPSPLIEALPLLDAHARGYALLRAHLSELFARTRTGPPRAPTSRVSAATPAQTTSTPAWVSLSNAPSMPAQAFAHDVVDAPSDALAPRAALHAGVALLLALSCTHATWLQLRAQALRLRMLAAVFYDGGTAEDASAAAATLLPPQFLAATQVIPALVTCPSPDTLATLPPAALRDAAAHPLLHLHFLPQFFAGLGRDARGPWFPAATLRAAHCTIARQGVSALRPLLHVCVARMEAWLGNSGVRRPAFVQWLRDVLPSDALCANVLSAAEQRGQALARTLQAPGMAAAAAATENLLSQGMLRTGSAVSALSAVERMRARDHAQWAKWVVDTAARHGARLQEERTRASDAVQAKERVRVARQRALERQERAIARVGESLKGTDCVRDIDDVDDAVKSAVHALSPPSAYSAANSTALKGVSGDAVPPQTTLVTRAVRWVRVRRALSEAERREARRQARRLREERAVRASAPVFAYAFGSLEVSVQEARVSDDEDSACESEDDDGWAMRAVDSVCVLLMDAADATPEGVEGSMGEDSRDLQQTGVRASVVSWETVPRTQPLLEVSDLSTSEHAAVVSALRVHCEEETRAAAVELTAKERRMQQRAAWRERVRAWPAPTDMGTAGAAEASESSDEHDEESAVVLATGAGGRVVSSRGVSRSLLARVRAEVHAEMCADMPSASGSEDECADQGEDK